MLHHCANTARRTLATAAVRDSARARLRLSLLCRAASDATTLKHDAGDDEHASGLFGGFSPLFAPAFAPPGLALSNGAPAPYAPAIVPAAPPRRAPFLRGSTLIAPSSPFSPLTQTVLATVAAVAQEHCLAVSAPVHVSIVANEATGSGVALLITFQPEDPFAVRVRSAPVLTRSLSQGTEFSEELENLYAMYSRKGFLTPQEYLRRKTEIVRRKLEELVAPLAEENWVEAERQLIAWQQSVAFRKHSSMASACFGARGRRSPWLRAGRRAASSRHGGRRIGRQRQRFVVGRDCGLAGRRRQCVETGT